MHPTDALHYPLTKRAAQAAFAFAAEQSSSSMFKLVVNEDRDDGSVIFNAVADWLA